MSAGDLVVVVVLCDDRQLVLGRGRGDERIGELDGSVCDCLACEFVEVAPEAVIGGSVVQLRA